MYMFTWNVYIAIGMYMCVCVYASVCVRERGRLVRQNLPKTNSIPLDPSVQVGTG